MFILHAGFTLFWRWCKGCIASFFSSLTMDKRYDFTCFVRSLLQFISHYTTTANSHSPEKCLSKQKKREMMSCEFLWRLKCVFAFSRVHSVINIIHLLACLMFWCFVCNSEVKKLDELEELNVSGNQLTTLPSSLGRLTKLAVLRAHSNSLHSLPSFRDAVCLRVSTQCIFFNDLLW